MHAVVISGRFNDRAAAQAELPDLTARVSRMPGFVAGHWMALSGEEAHAIIVFETEEGSGLAQAATAGRQTP